MHPDQSRVIRPSFAPFVIRAIFPAFVLCAAIVAAEIYLPKVSNIAVCALLIWLVYFATKTFIAILGASYTVTAETISARVGIISRNVSHIRTADIRGMNISQSILGRIFGYGNVVIGTAATGGAEIVMRDVSDPAKIIAEIDHLRQSAPAA